MHFLVKSMLFFGFLLSLEWSCSSFDISRFYDDCTIRTSSKKCCRPLFWVNSKYRRSCRQSPHNVVPYCQLKDSDHWIYSCGMNIMPEAGFAAPLGMQSGKIKSSQLSSGDKASLADLTKARLFGPDGWRPSDAYLGTAASFALISITLESLQQAPIFLLITFQRMKKISYFVIQDGSEYSDDYTQIFYILYNDTQWKQYSSNLAEELKCEETFGYPLQSCRHILKPFRAYSVKVVAKDYSSSIKPRWRMEFGGLDYLEADHYWALDKIMFRSGKMKVEIPDERGKRILQTTIPLNISISAARVEYAKDISLLASFSVRPTGSYLKTASDSTSCFFDVQYCVLGLSCSFWFHSTSNFGMLIRTSYPTRKGFALKWLTNGTLKAKIYSNKNWFVQYTVPECQSITPCAPEVNWLHVVAVWNKNSLTLYIDGKQVQTHLGTNVAAPSGSVNNLLLRDLLLLRDVRLWDYALSQQDINQIHNESTIDFTITALDNFGDWQTGVGCTGTGNTGPCTDQSFDAVPGDDVGPLFYHGSFVDFSTFDDYICNPSYVINVDCTILREYPRNVGITMGLTVEIDREFNYEEMDSFKIKFFAGHGSTANLNAKIYVATSYSFDSKYQTSCRSINFRRDVYTGPINWSAGTWQYGKNYLTPNLKTIIQGFFDKGNLGWQKYFFVTVEWIGERGSLMRIVTTRRPAYIITYYNKRPEKYLYADASMAPFPGYPMKYTTRPIVPKMKCLSFWYHMYGSGIGILSVSIQQQASVFTEIFRLYGNQGNRWHGANVPLNGLNDTSFQFQIIFTSIRGETTDGDIAIDTIKFHTNLCSLQPTSAAPPRYNQEAFEITMKSLNIPLPTILLPLEHGLSYFATQNLQVIRATPAHSKPIADIYGFPLADGYFDGGENSVVEIRPTYSIQNGSDFTLSFHARPGNTNESTLIWLGYEALPALFINLASSLNLTITLQDGSGLRLLESKIALKKDNWSYFALVYSKNEQTLTTYLNNTLVDEFNVNNLHQLPNPLKIFIGGENRTTPTRKFLGHISCVQLHDIALDAHVISANMLCPSKHEVGVCNMSCKMEGVCNQITRKCLCSPYSNRYVNEDCSNALNATIYQKASSYLSFDSRKHSSHYSSIFKAENDTQLQEKGLYFSTSGPVNLAICTTSPLPIRIKELESDCILKGTCLSKYSMSFWVAIPNWEKMQNISELTLLNIGHLTVKFVKNLEAVNSTWRNAHSLLANVTEGGQTCEWNAGNVFEFYGIWANFFISIDATAKSVSVYYNGEPRLASLTNCFAIAPTTDGFYLGGGSSQLCFDELALWQNDAGVETAKQLHDAISFSGFEKFPAKGINFSMLTFNDELGSLWAVDSNSSVYFYHPDQYWMKVDGKMLKVSAGRNGVWAIDTNRKLRFRAGINDNNTAGTDWALVDEASYGSVRLKSLWSGFASGIAFFINEVTDKLHCMRVTASGTVSSVSNLQFRINDIACSEDICLVQKWEGTTASFSLTNYQCYAPAMTEKQIKSDQISTDSIGNFFRIHNGFLYRYLSMVPMEGNLRYVISMNGQPVVITKNGQLKMIGSGDDTFKIFHSGGRCLGFKTDHHLRLYVKCDLFHWEKSGCIKHIASQNFVKRHELYLQSASNCIGNSAAQGFKREPSSTISKDGYQLTPNFQNHPGEIHHINAYSTAMRDVQSFEFFFTQASAFKKINSFFPRKKTKGTTKGELVYTATVSFRFRDLEYYDVFRDVTGLEGKFVHRRVEIELKQMFADSNSFIKSIMGEISSGEQVKFSCQFKDQKCMKPLEVKFQAMLFFSYISEHEREILISDKFNGVYTYCQDSECAFQLDVAQREVLAKPARVELVRNMSRSLAFKYHQNKIHGAHVGYNISYVGQYILMDSRIFVRNFTLRDGLIFNISSLQPYTAYVFTIIPLEIQTFGLAPISISVATAEDVPSKAPEVSISQRGNTSCTLAITSIPMAHWNGIPRGYRLYFGAVKDLTLEQRWKFTENVAGNFKFASISEASSSTYKIEELETFNLYVIYMAGFTDSGTGPYSRSECHTAEGVPKLQPETLNASHINATHVRVYWQPLAHDVQIWRNNQTETRGYKITLTELKYPRKQEKNRFLNVAGQSESNLVVGPLAADREYGFVISATNEIGDGPNTKQICLRIDEGVPDTGITFLNLTSKNASMIALTLGGMNVENENGRIMYYNISLTANTTMGELTEHIRVSITNNIIPNISSIIQVNATCNITKKSQCASTHRHVACPADVAFLTRTSNLLDFDIMNLRYWTDYEIRASACTCLGCGPYNLTINTRTDEHAPTCSTENINSTSVLSTSLNYSWAPLRQSCTHGYFTGYRVYFAIASSLTGSFNLSESWLLFDPAQKQDKYYVDMNTNEWRVDDLKKFTNYCIAILGSTVEGFGPPSPMHCSLTLQDRPDGPPMNVSVELKSGAVVAISMKQPMKDKANGIILGYTAYYSWKGEDGLWSTETNTTVKRLDENEGKTTALVGGLLIFKHYRFEVVAFTSVGEGSRTGRFHNIRTLEDTPSAAPRNFSARNISKSQIELQWLQVETPKLHGIFRNFKLVINETLMDGSEGRSRVLLIDANLTTLPAASDARFMHNITQSLAGNLVKVGYDNQTEFFSFSFVGLKAYTNYSVWLASCTTPGCGIKTNIRLRTRESHPTAPPRNVVALNASKTTELHIIWDEVPILQRNGIIIGYKLRWIKLCHFLWHSNTSSAIADCRRVMSNNASTFENKFVSNFPLRTVIGNLSSFTHYMIKIAAITSAGTGPETEVVAPTAENVPTVPPIVTAATNTSGRSIKIEWLNIPLPSQNGIIRGYTVRFERTNSSNGVREINCTHMSHNVTRCEIDKLDLYSYYSFSIGGYTSKGLGPFTDKFVIRTGPYVHGNWNEWLPWKSCSKTCGGGSRSRTRACDNPPPWNGGDNCTGASSETEPCNTRLCSGMFFALPGEDCLQQCNSRQLLCQQKIDLLDSAAKFKELGKKCKDEVTQATWKQPFHPAYVENAGICAGFVSIPSLVACNATPPDDGQTRRLCNCIDAADVGFTEWASWTYCSASCGDGKKMSRRECLSPDGICAGSNKRTQDCQIKPCPVDGQWSQWSAIEECNKTCGYGFQHRYRKCDSPPPSNGGDECYGQSVDVIGGCNPQLCPVNGAWSNWEGTGVCNQACGGGQLIQRRYCDNPRPEFGGAYCKGSPNKTDLCNNHNCKGAQILFWFRLTDFEWQYQYYALSSNIAVDLSLKIQSDVFATYDNAAYVTGIRVQEFRRNFPTQRARREITKEYVVANVAVFFSEVTQSEILYLQDYVTSNGKLFTLNVTESAATALNVLSNPPRNLTVEPLDPNTLHVTWTPPINMSQASNITGYYLFYREKDADVGRWEVLGIPLANNSFTLTRLKPRAWYKVRMTVSVAYGNGPACKEVLVQTPEGMPSLPPSNLQLQPIQPTQIYVQWDNIPLYYYHGFPLGYIIKYKNYQDNIYHEVKVGYGATGVVLTKLEPFSVYVVIVYAYTAVGLGPGSTNTTKTLEGVPSNPPPNVKVKERYALDSITVIWDSIPEGETNGRFKGYRVKYMITKVSGEQVIMTGSRKEIVVDKYTNKLKITSLQSYTVYAVSVCGFTEAGNGPSSKPVFAETCNCPYNIFVNWYESRPYVTKGRNGAILGLFKEIADEMIEKSCVVCNGVTSKINYYISPNGESPEKASELKLRAKIGSGYHISFPIFGRAEMRTILDSHIFVALVKSSGSAMIVSGAIDYTAKTLNALKSIKGAWPMVVIIILMSVLIGILMWSVEQFNNEEFSRGRYLNGMCQGLWWAYVSMTTVGYGDISPRTFPGRILGIIWTLIGLILTGILTGALTSTVTTLTVPPDATLYDTNAAVINKSYEYGLAVRRNAKVAPAMRFEKANQVLSALHKKQVKVALLDAFATASHASTIADMNLKVTKVIPGNTGFGFVLSDEFVRLESDFKSHILSKQDRITVFIANMTNMLQLSNDEVPNIKLLDPKTPAFWIVLQFELYLLAFLIFLGVLWTVVQVLRKGRKIAPPQDAMVKFIESIPESIEKFHDRLVNELEQINQKQDQEMQALIDLKKNFNRHSKKIRKNGVLFA